MKVNLHFSLLLITIVSLFLNGCALSHHAAGVYLRTDRGLYSQLTDPIAVTLSSNIVPPEQYHLIQYQITDNGREIAAGTISRDTREINPEVPFPHAYGPHSISARARPYNSETDHGDWITSIPAMVCIFVGSDPPDTVSCNTYGFPQHLEITTETPAIYTIVTETPVVTPLIIIRPDNNANNNGGSNPGGATGCAAYSDKASCDLAGCSWNGSACTVTP